MFDSEFGPPVTDGPDANWFPPASVFLLDELHRWFSQRQQDTEPPELLTYLTMPRHHLHWIMVMTQNRMQLSVPWRENCVRLVHKAKPSETRLELPLLSGGFIWRLYDSFTHIGNQRQLEKRLRNSQKSIEGEFYKEPSMPRRRGSRLWPLLTVTSSCVAGASLVFAMERKPPEPKAALTPGPVAVAPSGFNAASLPGSGRAGATSGPTSRPVLDAQGNVIKEPPQLFPFKVSAVSNDGCVVEGSYVARFGYFNGWCLLASMADVGSTMWTNDTDSVVVGVGGGMPRKIDRVRVPDIARPPAPTTRPYPTTAQGPGGVDWFGNRAAAGPSTRPAD